MDKTKKESKKLEKIIQIHRLSALCRHFENLANDPYGSLEIAGHKESAEALEETFINAITAEARVLLGIK